MSGLITTTVLTGACSQSLLLFWRVFLGSSFYRKLETAVNRQVIVGLITLLGLLTLAKALGLGN